MVTRHFILQWAFNKNTRFFLLLATFFFSVQAWAATANDNATTDTYIRSQLQQCASLPDHERLACYDRLATSSGIATTESPSAPDAIVNPISGILRFRRPYSLLLKRPSHQARQRKVQKKIP